MTQTVSTQDLDPTSTCVDDATVAVYATQQESWDTRARLKRMESCLALVLGALTEFHEGGADYVMHRLSLELRRLAEMPAAAASRLGCPEDEIDPHLLQAIAAHLHGSQEDAAWATPTPDIMVMH